MDSCTSPQSPGQTKQKAPLCHSSGPSAARKSFLFSSHSYSCFKGGKSPFGFTMPGPPVSLCFYIICFANRRMQGLPFGRCEKSHTILCKYEVTALSRTLWCWEVGPFPHAAGWAHLAFLEVVHFPSPNMYSLLLRKKMGCTRKSY